MKCKCVFLHTWILFWFYFSQHDFGVWADYVILHATEPVTHNPVWRALNPAQQDQTLFEERHLRYISPLGKVRPQFV